MKKRTDPIGPDAGPRSAPSRRTLAARLRARSRNGGRAGREYEAARVHAELSVIAEHRNAFDHFIR
jgi:hypothetical protein